MTTAPNGSPTPSPEASSHVGPVPDLNLENVDITTLYVWRAQIEKALTDRISAAAATTISAAVNALGITDAAHLTFGTYDTGLGYHFDTAAAAVTTADGHALPGHVLETVLTALEAPSSDEDDSLDLILATLSDLYGPLSRKDHVTFDLATGTVSV